MRRAIVSALCTSLACLTLAMTTLGCDVSSDVSLKTRTVQAAHLYTVTLDGLTIAANQGVLDLQAAEQVEKGRVAAKAALNDMRRNALAGAKAGWETAWSAFKSAMDALASEQIKADLRREDRQPTPAAIPILEIITLIAGLSKLAASVKRRGDDEATDEEIDEALQGTNLADARWQQALERLRNS